SEVPMMMRFTVAVDGRTQVETISALEDLWHDFQFFKLRSSELDLSANSPADHLIAKRYRRVALLALVFYFEGVFDRWPKQLPPEADWIKKERQCMEKKVKEIQSRLPEGGTAKPEIADAKEIRDMLAHLKPGVDARLYDEITSELLDKTEASVTVWLNFVETC